MTTTATQLQTLLHRHIPISQHMGIEVLNFDGQQLHLRAPLDANVNVHGTGFAGSIYAVAALTGWGMMTLQLGVAQIEGSVVIADAQIKYLRPVNDSICTQCAIGPEFEQSLQRLRERGRASFELTATVGPSDDPEATLIGKFAVRVR